MVVFRLGRYKRIPGPGLYWIIHLFERQRTIDMRTRTVTVERQKTITKDSVTAKVDTVLWYRVIDAAKTVIAAEDYNLDGQKIFCCLG